METTERTPEPSSRVKTAFTFAVAAGALFLAYQAQHVIFIALLGVLLAIVIDAVARFGTRRLKMRRGVAVTAGALLLLLGFAGTIALIAAPILAQSSELAEVVPEKTESLRKTLDETREKYPILGSVLPSGKNKEEKGPPASQAAKTAAITASKALEGVVVLVAIFFLGLFFAWDPERYTRGVARLLPGAPLEERVRLVERLGEALRSYLVALGAQIVLMAVLWAIGLWLIGIPYFIVFGAIAGIVEIVPYVGPMLGLVPPLLLGGGGGKAIAVVVLYALLHVFEGYILVPLLMKKREELPPPVTLLSVLGFGAMFGFMGILLAVPLGTIAYVWVTESILHLPHEEKDEEKRAAAPARQGAVTVERGPFRPGLAGGL